MRALVLAVMLGMLLVPLTANRAGAEDLFQVDPAILQDVPLDLDPEVLDPVIVDPGLDPSPEPTLDIVDLPDVDLPDIDEVYDPSIYPNDLYVNPVLCPADLDLWSVDYYGLAFNCQGGFADGYELFVSDSASNWWIHQVINGSGVGQSGLPSDTYRIDIYHPSGGGNSLRIICSADDMLGNDAIGAFDLAVDTYGGSLDLTGDLSYFCDVFINVDGFGQAAENIDLYLNKHTCPEGVWSDNPYFIAQVCQGTLEGVTFNVTDGLGNPFSADTAGFPAMATFNQIANGTITVAEVIPAGYAEPIVFCDAEDLAGNELLGAYVVPPVAGGAFSLDLPAETATVFCDIYNVPVDSDGGSIVLFKWECPAGIDFNISDPALDCGLLLNGVTFTAEGPNGYFAQTDTGDSINGAVFFGGLEEGSYTLTETLPATMERAWLGGCVSDTVDASGYGNFDLGTDPAFQLTLEDEEDIVCHVYNVPYEELDDNAEVFITKWGCPEGFYSDVHQELLDECDYEMEGVDFTIEHESGATDTDDTGGQPARAAFTPWYTGTSTVTEDVPAGYGGPVVYCYAQDEFGTIVPGYDLAFYPTVNGSWEIVIPAVDGQIVSFFCDVFNFPTNDGWVTIHKWECPEGVNYGENVDYYLAECTVVMENVEFASGPHMGIADLFSTDNNGELSLEVDPNEEWAIVEHVPAGYGDPVVFCGWGGYMDDGNGGVIAIDGFANLDGQSGAALIFNTYDQFGMDCNWFNIPHDEDQEITVYKYTCPEGYDFEDPAADPQADCTELTNGINFHLYPDGGTELQSQTGDSINGAVYFGGVDTGDFTIVEDVPNDIYATYVTCQWFDNWGPYVYQQFFPYQYDGTGVGNAIDVELAYGDEMVCQWYNAPEKHWDGGELTIVKYWCTGYVVTPAHCELGSGVEFLVEYPGGGYSELVETGASGSVTLHDLAAGSYEVSETDYEWCKAVATKVDGLGNIVIEEGEETVLTVYNCTGSDKGKKDETVTKFPNTGAGSFDAASDDEMILLTAVAAALAMMGFALRMGGASLATATIRTRQ
jgi:hypothetical protein